MALADGEVGGSLPWARIAIETVRESGGWWSSVGAAVIALLVGLVWLKLVEAERRRKLLPPGPRPWPIVGNFPALARRLPYRFLQTLAFKYGGLMYLRLGVHPIIFALVLTKIQSPPFLPFEVHSIHQAISVHFALSTLPEEASTNEEALNLSARYCHLVVTSRKALRSEIFFLGIPTEILGIWGL